MKPAGAAAIVALALVGVAPPRAATAEPRAAAAPATRTTLDGLLQSCAKSPGLYAKYVEEKQVALLAVPLRTEGTVHFAPGRGLVRHTLVPSRQSVLVTDRELVFWDGKTVKRIPFGTSKTVETLARAFSLLLAADRAGLERDFALTFRRTTTTPDDDAWLLELLPTSAELAKSIRAIEIEGRGLVLSTLRVREANGDLSTTRFSDVDTARRYVGEELEATFRVPPA